MAALMGPASLPRGNSEQVSFSSPHYTVNVFQCPTAGPVNSSLIGQGMCGAMESFAEGFGATIYPTAAAARGALTYQTPPGTPVAMSLPGGLTGSRWRIHGQKGPTARRRLCGTKATGPLWSQAGRPSAVPSAVLVTHLLQHYLLPPHPGLLTVDVAGDGLHTSAQWVLGSTVYFTSAMHSPAQAVTMAASLKPFPAEP